MENDFVDVGVGSLASRLGIWSTFVDLGVDGGPYTAESAISDAVADTKAPEYPETSYSTIIGIVFAGGENARLISVADFCALLSNRELSFIDEDYFDETLVTELTKFTFDSFAGTAIDWNRVEQLVMGRSNILKISS